MAAWRFVLGLPEWRAPAQWVTSAETHALVRSDLARVQDLVCATGSCDPEANWPREVPRSEWEEPSDAVLIVLGDGLPTWSQDRRILRLDPPVSDLALPVRFRAPLAHESEGESELLLVALLHARWSAQEEGQAGPTLHFTSTDDARELELRALVRALGLESAVRWECAWPAWETDRDCFVALSQDAQSAAVQRVRRRGIPVLLGAGTGPAADGSIRVVDPRRPELVGVALHRLAQAAGAGSPRPSTSACAEFAARFAAAVETLGIASRSRLPAKRSDRIEKISVVVPSFNQASFLAATLDSILQQNVPADLEVLVFDGGSTDGSVDILRRYGDRIAWVSEADDGQTDAINRGLRRASGDLLAYLNSDDVYLPGALAAVLERFRAQPELQLGYGRAWHLRADGAFLEDYPTERWDWSRLLETCFICQPATFWRRSVLDRHGLFDARLRYAMDYEFWLRVGAREPLHYLHDLPPLAGSRLHAETKTLGAKVGVHREIVGVIQRYAPDSPAVRRWLGHLAYWRTQQEGSDPVTPAARREHALRWSSHLLLAAEECGVPVDAGLLADLELHLEGQRL